MKRLLFTIAALLVFASISMAITPLPTATPRGTLTPTPTVTVTATATATPTGTIYTATVTDTVTHTITPTVTITLTPVPTSTPVNYSIIPRYKTKGLTFETSAGGAVSYNISPTAGTTMFIEGIYWFTSATQASGVITLSFMTGGSSVIEDFVSVYTMNHISNINMGGGLGEACILTISGGGNAQKYGFIIKYREE